MPDASSLTQLPWKPEVAWLAGDCWMGGAPMEDTPRLMLKRQVALAAKKGYRMKTGIEAEFFLINEDGSDISDPRDTQGKPCYDQTALMRRFDVVADICDSMETLGWAPYQNDHEDANGQFEMNYDYCDTLQSADRHVFFKYMVKSIAEEHDLRATFMPKPFAHLTGNGCHTHVSIWDKTGKKNLFEDKKGPLGMSQLSHHFIGGILNAAQGLSSIFNPTVNSYKRLNAGTTASGATWAPNAITFGGNNRTTMVRIPGPGRFELRSMDGAANPYLMQAGTLMAGLEGISSKRDPGKCHDIDMFAEGHKVRGIRKLPLNLLDAIRVTEKDKVINEGFGKSFVQSYTKLKRQEWQSYTSHLSQWERDNSLDC